MITSAGTGPALPLDLVGTTGPFYPGQVQDVLWSNDSGSKLIVVAHRPGPPVPLGKHSHDAANPIELGVVSGNRFTPLPGAPSLQSLGFGSWPVW